MPGSIHKSISWRFLPTAIKTISSGNVVITRDIVDTVKGRKVLLIDDILESGRTMAFATKELLDRGAETVKTCLMLDKKGKRVSGFEADFVGFDCPDLFVVGYGLDYAHFLPRTSLHRLYCETLNGWHNGAHIDRRG